MQFTDTSFGDINHWTWNFGDGSGSTNQHPTHPFSAQGVYSMSLITSTPLGVLSTTNHAIIVVANYRISGGSYSWVTPSSKDSLALGNDGVSAALMLPFLFKFYGETYTQVYIGANGLMGFNSNLLSASLNTALPGPASPNNILCPFWDDLNALPSTTIDSGTVGIAPQRRFVVSWNGVSTVGARPTSLTFQVVLEETSNRILFQYQDVASASKSGSASGGGCADTAHATEDNQRHDGRTAGAGFSREKAQGTQKRRGRLGEDSSSETGTNPARPSYL